MIFAAFKAVDSVLRGSNGGFDSHTLPPYRVSFLAVALTARELGGATARQAVPVGSNMLTILLFACRSLSGTACV